MIKIAYFQMNVCMINEVIFENFHENRSKFYMSSFQLNSPRNTYMLRLYYCLLKKKYVSLLCLVSEDIAPRQEVSSFSGKTCTKQKYSTIKGFYLKIFSTYQ